MDGNYGANTAGYKTTLAVHDERLNAQKEQAAYLLSTVHRYQTAVAKEIKDLRNKIEEKDDETYRFISDKFDEFEHYIDDKLQRVYEVIRDEEKKNQLYLENEIKRNDDKFKVINDFLMKLADHFTFLQLEGFKLVLSDYCLIAELWKDKFSGCLFFYSQMK